MHEIITDELREDVIEGNGSWGRSAKGVSGMGVTSG
jgi:hypothetical protein